MIYQTLAVVVAAIGAVTYVSVQHERKINMVQQSNEQLTHALALTQKNCML
jgi:uncharacterized protein (UPF0333 family)